MGGITKEGERDAGRFEVAGERAGGMNAVKHIGLLAKSMHVIIGADADVVDMGLSLTIEPPARMRVDVLGWLPLSEDEEEELWAWLDDMDSRKVVTEYRALPAEELSIDPKSGLVNHCYFSCAGFVCRAYQEVIDKPLVDVGALPTSDLALVDQIWLGGVLRRCKQLPPRLLQHLKQFGMTGSGPWPVLLPGHVLRALQEERSTLPYRPTLNDATFPYT